MPKSAPVAALLLLLGTLSAVSQAQPADTRLMSDPDFKAFLLQVEVALPKWEKDLKSIDAEKVGQISYSRGKSFLDQRDLGLTEISNIRLYISKQRVKRTVSGELVWCLINRVVYTSRLIL